MVANPTQTANTPAAKAPVDFGATGSKGPNAGLLVQRIVKSSSAEKAGLKAGDEIVAIGDKKVGCVVSATGALQEAGVGARVMVRVVRAKTVIDVPMTINAKRKLSLDIEPIDEVLERKISP
jgi:S1-C subfamily serine protease